MQGKRNRRPRGTGSIRELNGRLYGKVYVGGRPVERVIGPATMNSREREAKLREIATEMNAVRPIEEHRVTIAEVAAAHLAGRKTAGKKKSTLDGYERDTRVHYVPFFEDKPIGRITEADIDRYIDEKLGACLTRKTVRNQLNHLHAIFKFAIRKKWATFNPVELVDRPADAAKDPEIHFLTIEQLDDLVRAGEEGIDRPIHTIRSLERGAKIRQLREKGLDWKTIGLAMDCSPATAIYLSRCTSSAVEHDLLAATDRVIWLVAAMTGLRQGELLSLLWRHIDWTAETIRVHKNSSAEGTVKSEGSFRAVPMATRVARELELHFQASGFQGDHDRVFGHPITGRHLDRTGVTKRFERALGRAKLPGITFHELRHTFGTTMAAAGVPMRTLQEWLGHADIKTTQIYAHYSPRPHEARLIDAAFGADHSTTPSAKPSATENNPAPQDPMNTRDRD